MDNQHKAQFRKFLNALVGVQMPEKESGVLVDSAQKAVDYNTEHQKLTLDIRRAKQKRRAIWDRVLLTLVVAGFFFSYSMILLIGLDVLHFPDQTFAVPAVVGAGIIQTYGLARIAAQYFFSEDRKLR